MTDELQVDIAKITAIYNELQNVIADLEEDGVWDSDEEEEDEES